MRVGWGGEGYKNAKSSSRMLDGSENIAGSSRLEAISSGKAVLLALRFMLWIRNKTRSDERMAMSASGVQTWRCVSGVEGERSDGRTL